MITRRATDELEELISISPSLSLEDTVRIRLIKAKDMRTVEATTEDGGYRSDPDLQVVDVNLSIPTRRNFNQDIYPPPSLYYSIIHQNLNSDLTYSRKTGQRKWRRRRSEDNWAEEIQGMAASLLLSANHKSRSEYLPKIIHEIRKTLIEKHNISRHPDVNNGHLDFLSEELASTDLLVEFDALLYQSILTDDLFERAIHKIIHVHTQAKISACTGCEPVISFLPILLELLIKQI